MCPHGSRMRRSCNEWPRNSPTKARAFLFRVCRLAMRRYCTRNTYNREPTGTGTYRISSISGEKSCIFYIRQTVHFASASRAHPSCLKRWRGAETPPWITNYINPVHSTLRSFFLTACPCCCATSADGSIEDIGVPLEDVKARKAVCAPGQQHMYPLGDGRGGLLTRRRWKGSSPRPQLVQHIGETG